MKRKVNVYTDGSCLGNPGPGGYGVVLLYGSNKKEISGGYRLTTNNRMEIIAAIKGLQALKEPCEVTLYSDSQYLVNAITRHWVYKWRDNNWMRNKKEPALNVDLWKELLALMDIHDVTFIWVKGHADNQYNNRCDILARTASSGEHLQVDAFFEQ